MDRERTRMAYALHDGLVQTVTSAILELEVLRKRFERDPDAALVTLDQVKSEIRRSSPSAPGASTAACDGRAIASMPTLRCSRTTSMTSSTLRRPHRPSEVSRSFDTSRKE